MANEIDYFALDLEDRKEDISGEYRDPILKKMSEPIGESDVPSIFLPGAVAGAWSQEESSFKLISDETNGPKGVILSDKERLDCQISSVKRHRTDPQYSGILDTYLCFSVGKGVEITPEDESEEVSQYVDDFKNYNTWDGLDVDISARILEAGEVFVRFFFKGAGLPARVPAIRLLNFWEISKIEYDKADKDKPLAYIRPYREEGDTQVKYETIPAEEIVHIKFGRGYEKRGLPPFLCIIQQCQYYIDWLFCRVVLNRLKSSYYLEEIVDGSPSAVQSQDNVTPDALTYGQSGKAQKRLPKIGSKIVHNKAVEYKWLKPEIGADDAKEDGRSIRLSICAGAQIPEFVLGDASNANYNSALVAQNPFVRRVEMLRDFLEHNFESIFEKVINYGIQNNFISGMSTETVMKEKAANVGLIRRLKKFFRYEEAYDKAGNIVITQPVETKTGIDIQWPNLIAEKLLEDSQAYQIHQAMGIVSNETLSSRLGYDFEEESRKIQREQDEAAANNPNPQPGDANYQEPMPPLPGDKNAPPK